MRTPVKRQFDTMENLLAKYVSSSAKFFIRLLAVPNTGLLTIVSKATGSTVTTEKYMKLTLVLTVHTS